MEETESQIPGTEKVSPSLLPPATKARLFELARVLQRIHNRLAAEAREKESQTSTPVDIRTAWKKTVRRDGLNGR
jgi:hypothetical protein